MSKYDSLIARLRDTDIDCGGNIFSPASLIDEAADAIAALVAENTKMLADCKDAGNALGETEAENERLRAERDAAVADAERLDWLLDHALVIHMRGGYAGLATMDRDGIDAARQHTAQEPT